MNTIPTLPGIESRMVETARLTMHVLFSGDEGGEPVLFVHGNASSATYWEETMLALPEGFRAIAPDLRGYGATEGRLVDATRGMGDWVDDLLALMETLGHERFHVIGHSLGGAVLWALIAAAPGRVLTATMAAPGSPYGFGGSRPDGTPIYEDGAGSGGGVVNAEFVRLIAAGDRSEENPQASPRVVMNSFYWKPPFRPAREEELLSGLLSERVGPEHYPGDVVPSANWPHVAPRRFGPANALAPIYVGDTVERLVAAEPKPPILWIRGADDAIVGDNSFFEMGTLGSLGYVPGWPGAEAYPPQPMVAQTRAVLERYAANGGAYREEVFEETGHTPYLEQPERFNALFHEHLTSGRS